jgi:hypothetical protein
MSAKSCCEADSPMLIVCSSCATSCDVKPARLRPCRRGRCGGLCRAELVGIDADYGADTTHRNARLPEARSSRCRARTGVPVLAGQRNIVNGKSPPPGSADVPVRFTDHRDIVAEVR